MSHLSVCLPPSGILHDRLLLLCQPTVYNANRHLPYQRPSLPDQLRPLHGAAAMGRGCLEKLSCVPLAGQGKTSLWRGEERRGE